MNCSEIKISKAFLQSGNDLYLSGKFHVKHPSLEEILSLGDGIYCDDFYWSYVFTLLSDPYDNMVWLDDLGIDYETVTAFDVFMMRWEYAVNEYDKRKEEFDTYGTSPLECIRNALSFFLGDTIFEMGMYSDGTKALYDTSDHSVQIGKETFEYITTFIRVINGITRLDKINPADENAKKILIEDTRNEQRKRLRKKTEHGNDYLGDMIAAVVHGGNGGVTPFNFQKLSIYQLYSAMSVEQKKMHYNHVMQGVYAGTISSDQLSKNDLEWMN